MKTSKVLFFLLVLFCCSVKNPPTEKLVTREEGNKVIKAQTKLYFDSIGLALVKKKYGLHGKQTLIALRYLNKIPIHFLSEADNSLKVAIEKYGFRPFYGVTLDIVYRLSIHPTKENQKRLAAMRKLIREKLKPEPDTLSRVLIRSAFARKSRAYSENLARIVLAFSVSKKGQDMYSMGGRPEDLVRLSAMFANSAAKLLTDRGLTAADRNSHQTVVDNLLDMVDKTGILSHDPEARIASLRKGIMYGPEAFDDGSNSLTEGFEDRIDQMENAKQGRTSSSMGPQGYMMSDNATPNASSGSSQPGQAPTGYTQDGVQTDSNIVDGKKTTTTTTEYKDSNGNKMTVTRSTVTNADGTTQSTTHISSTDANGTTQTQTYSGSTIRQSTTTDSEGNMTNQTTYDSNGNVSQSVDSKPATPGTYSVDGSDIYVTAGDIDVTTTTYDRRGKISSTRTWSSARGGPLDLPADETSKYIGPNPFKPYTIEQLAGMALAPLINPNPEVVTATDIALFAQFNNEPQWCPAFFALCVEPGSGCSCGQALNGDFKNAGASRCAAMLCDNGCNPDTGMCGSSGEFLGAFDSPEMENVNYVGWTRDIFQKPEGLGPGI